jgi:hypothetical protein
MATAYPLTDHDKIRQWAEARGARPARVRGTGRKPDLGVLRLEFPGQGRQREALERVSWKEWLASFEDSDLALLVQDDGGKGPPSRFNKLVRRDLAGAK